MTTPREGTSLVRRGVAVAGRPKAEGAPQGVRLQRVLAEAGVAARRACEKLITDGRVTVNGQVVRTLPVFVDPRRDRIVADGQVVSRGTRRGEVTPGDEPPRAAQRKVYVMFNKPPRVMTTTSDPGGRTTVMDLVKHPAEVRLFPVGRLDFHDSGLVLLTNDGELANRLTHARYGVARTYQVAVKGRLDDAFVADLGRGLQAKMGRAARERGSRAGKIEVRRVAADKSDDERARDKTVLEVRLQGGKPMPLDELLGAAGVKVARVTQVGLGPLELKGVAPANWRELDRTELAHLRRATGLTRGAGK